MWVLMDEVRKGSCGWVAFLEDGRRCWVRREGEGREKGERKGG